MGHPSEQPNIIQLGQMELAQLHVVMMRTAEDLIRFLGAQIPGCGPERQRALTRAMRRIRMERAKAVPFDRASLIRHVLRFREQLDHQPPDTVTSHETHGTQSTGARVPREQEPVPRHSEAARDRAAHLLIRGVVHRVCAVSPEMSVDEVEILVAQCRCDLDIAHLDALPELLERLALQRLSDRAATNGSAPA